MTTLRLSAVTLAVATLFAAPRMAFADDTSTSTPALQLASASPVGNQPGDGSSDTIKVTAKKLDKARSQLLPETGSTIYRFDTSDLDALPQGEDTPLNQVILQAPGVVQDSYGQLHVRGDHANLQYRINGVIIPEAMTGFGQSLDTHLASQINVLTGALPAEYGYRTAGVVDIQTKGVDFPNGGDVSVVGGTNNYAQGSVQVGGSNGPWNYYLNGDYLRDDLGIENPISTRNALHDHTTQGKGFGFVSRVLDDSSRISAMFGVSNNSFQIPDVPGQTPNYTLAGTTTVDSSTLNAHQNEQNQFQVLSYQASPTEQIDYEVSLFHRLSDVHYYPDPTGDLMFNGVAAAIFRKVDSIGLQGDTAYKLTPTHTVRAGFFAEHERFGADALSTTFPADNNGNQTSSTPITIYDTDRLQGGTWGVYLQDEWQATSNLVINYGARFDRTTTVTQEQQFSPRLGMVYDLSPDTRIHAGYARYFTPPPTEIIGAKSVAAFNNTTNQSPVQADTSVLAERSHYFDVGITHKLTQDWSVGLDAYYRRVTHLQDEGQFGSALIFSAFNYNEGRIKGFELSTSYKHDNLSAYLNVARSQALGKEFITGQYNFTPDKIAYAAGNWIHLDHDQKLAASGGASYKLGDLTFGGDVLYGSGLRSGFANTQHLPSYTQVNLNAEEAFRTEALGKFKVRLSALNVFDKVYEIRDGTGVGVGAPQWGPRRGLFLGLDKPF
ncbi:MAG: TonB-dependent receptor [Burkholderiales bacterium]|nr:TonB-dependent receptor [Burkholderiales bacterium]